MQTTIVLQQILGILLLSQPLIWFFLLIALSETELNSISVILRWYFLTYEDKVILAWKINIIFHQLVRHHSSVSQIKG